MPSPTSLFAHTDNLLLSPLVSALDDLIEAAGDKARIDTADGRIAGFLFERLFAVRSDLQPVIARLARIEAEREAAVEAGIAEFEAAWETPKRQQVME